MRQVYWIGLIGLFIVSCNNPQEFPKFVTQKVDSGKVEIISGWNSMEGKGLSGPVLPVDSLPELDTLRKFKLLYLQKNGNFDLVKFHSVWSDVRDKVYEKQLLKETALYWFELTGFLFQLTGDACIAEEMEKTVWSQLPDASDSMISDSLIAPYIFTKDVDNIHVNLLLPAKISYIHSMGGGVSITQQIDFPSNVRLIFNMETKRHINVFMRIPSWVENASVTVKKVKYFAQPGSYCIISKKWKEGDEVEIKFSVENLPDYFQL